MTAHTGQESLPEAVKGADLVIIPAGVPRKPGMTRDDLFNINASIVRDLSEAIAKHAPNVRRFPSYCSRSGQGRTVVVECKSHCRQS